MYTGYHKLGDPPRQPYSANTYKWVAAHEFGHILGVDDVYNVEKCKQNTKSILNRSTEVQDVDITKVLKA